MINITLQITAPVIPDFNINDLTEEVAGKVFKKIISSTPRYHDTWRWSIK